MIPLFNEQEVVPFLRSELLRTVQNEIPGCEIILVDDASTDGTLGELQAWAAADLSVTVIRHATNLGQSSSIRTGMLVTQGEYVAILDADLQDPPALLIDMLISIQESKLDMVAAQRTSRAGERAAKRLTAWIFYRVVDFLLPFEVTRDAGEFRMVSQSCVEKLRQYRGPIPIMRIFLDSIAESRAVLPFARQVRRQGLSHYSWLNMIQLAIMTLSYISTARFMDVTATAVGVLFGAVVFRDDQTLRTLLLLVSIALGVTVFLTMLGKRLSRRTRWTPLSGQQMTGETLSRVS